jgi:hypothetical protein
MNTHRLARWGRNLAFAAVISVVSIVGTIVWVVVSIGPLPAPRPPSQLTKDLRGTWAAISLEMDRRVKAKFPVGSPEDALITELRHEAYTKEDWRAAIDQEHEARREENDGICNKAAYVFWRADSNGALTSVRGEYREEGCL